MAGKWAINDCYSSLSCWRIQVRVDESGEMFSETEEIAGGNNGVACHFAFNDQVTLMDERILETVSEVVDTRGSRRRGRQDVREDRRSRITSNVGCIVRVPQSAAVQLAGTELTAWPVDRPVLMSELMMIVPLILP